ncbi:MAG: acyltransferase [Oscillospiraceae bacterium]|nr:acyltransferase [Oscillospiraceae bacterium]
MNINKKAVIYGGFELRSPWNITIGASVIGVGALLDGRCGIEIGDDVTLAQNVSIFTLQHDLNDEMFRTNNKGGKVIIEKWSWISSNTTILPGVCVCTGAVLASGGIATKDLECYSVYGGIPAKKIAERSQNLKYSLANNDYWHFY